MIIYPFISCGKKEYCTSEAIKRILAPQFHPTTTLRKLLVHVKDPVPMEKRTGVV